MELKFQKGIAGCLMVGDVAIVPNLYHDSDRAGVEVIHPNNRDSKIVDTWEELVQVVNGYSR